MNEGRTVRFERRIFRVPDDPRIPVLIGAGVDTELWGAVRPVIDAAVRVAFEDGKRIVWMPIDVSATQGASSRHVVDAVREHRFALFAGLDVNLRHSLVTQLHLDTCQHWSRWLNGMPSPLARPERHDVLLFTSYRMNGAYRRQRQRYFTQLLGVMLRYAQQFQRFEIALVSEAAHAGPADAPLIDEVLAAAIAEFGGEQNRDGSFTIPNGDEQALTLRSYSTTQFLTASLLHPERFSVVVATPQSEPYVLAQLSAAVGGVGMVPAGFANYALGRALFGPSHGEVLQLAGKNSANPTALLLAAEMLLCHLNWHEAADLILHALGRAFGHHELATADVAFLSENLNTVTCAAFARAVLEAIQCEELSRTS